MRVSMRYVLYAVLALAGAGATWYWTIQFMMATGDGFDPAAFVSGGFVNPAPAPLSADVSVAALTFVLWMLFEARRLGMRSRLMYVAVTLCVAFACASPLFLLMREVHIARQAGNTGGGG